MPKVSEKHLLILDLLVQIKVKLRVQIVTTTQLQNKIISSLPLGD